MKSFLLASLVAFFALGCVSVRDDVVTPANTRTAVRATMQIALTSMAVEPAKVTQYKVFVSEARALLATGDVPAQTLDVIAAKLNAQIDSPVVRAVIQSGVEAIKAQVTLPVSGIIPDEVKIWILAVLDGAIDGMTAYLNSQVPTGTPYAVKKLDTISFR